MLELYTISEMKIRDIL